MCAGRCRRTPRACSACCPALQTQEALVIGEGVTLPMRVRLDDLEEVNRPRSETAVFSEVWQQDSGEQADLIAQTIDRWRRQAR